MGLHGAAPAVPGAFPPADASGERHARVLFRERVTRHRNHGLRRREYRDNPASTTECEELSLLSDHFSVTAGGSGRAISALPRLRPSAAFHSPVLTIFSIAEATLPLPAASSLARPMP